MGHLGMCPPGDRLLVLGRWLPPHERGLFKIVEPVMDGHTYYGIRLPEWLSTCKYQHSFYRILPTMFHL
jgi:hypothetical protein